MTTGDCGAPLRLAALTLHALAPVDRAWMLAALSPADRHQVEPLLEELEALGIPRDPQLLETALSEDAPHCGAVGVWPAVLGDAEIVALRLVLAREPAGLTRALLALGPWPWGDRLLHDLDASRRAEVQAQPASGPPSGRLAQELLLALATAVQREPAPAAAEGRWRRLLSRRRRHA